MWLLCVHSIAELESSEGALRKEVEALRGSNDKLQGVTCLFSLTTTLWDADTRACVGSFAVQERETTSEEMQHLRGAVADMAAVWQRVCEWWV